MVEFMKLQIVDFRLQIEFQIEVCISEHLE